jgi:hypothetical protein
MGEQFLREPRLPNARLAREQHEVTARLLGALPMLLQLQRFRRAIDEPSTHELLERSGGGCTHILDAERREIGRQIAGYQLIDRLGIGKATQLVRAKIAQRRSLRQTRRDLACRGSRKQRLASVARRRDALHAHERQRREVFPVTRLRSAGVQTHAHAYLADFAPILLLHCALRRERCGERVVRAGECREQRVADHLEHSPAVRFDRSLQQALVASECVPARIGMTLDELRGALDIGKQESDHAARQPGRARLAHRAEMMPSKTLTAKRVSAGPTSKSEPY